MLKQLIGSGFTATGSGYDALVLAKSPIAWWKQDATSGTSVADSAGSNTLTHNGGVVVGKLPLKPGGYCAYYDGVDDFSSRAANVLTNQSTYSIEVLLQIDAIPDVRTILLCGSIESGNRRWFFIEEGIIYFQTEEGGIQLEPGEFVAGPTQPTFLPGNLYHITLVRRTTKFFFYINGVEFEGATDIPAAGTPTTASTLVGAARVDDNTKNSFFKGCIDDLIIYPTALSAAETLAHCQAALQPTWVAGRSIDNSISGLTASTAKPLYTSATHTGTPAYTRNVNNWLTLAGVDHTCVPAWNSGTGITGNGILISPRHFIAAKHYNSPKNTETLRFVKMDNTIVNKTVAANLIQIGSSDIVVGVLDSDVGSGITFAKVPPSDWRRYFPNPEDLPVVIFDGEKKATVADVSMFGFVGAGIFKVPSNAQRLAFNELMTVGDSGAPACMLLGGELVALLTIFGGGSGSVVGDGPMISEYYAAINSAMTTLGGGYQLTAYDFTGWKKY